MKRIRPSPTSKESSPDQESANHHDRLAPTFSPNIIRIPSYYRRETNTYPSNRRQSVPEPLSAGADGNTTLPHHRRMQPPSSPNTRPSTASTESQLKELYDSVRNSLNHSPARPSRIPVSVSSRRSSTSSYGPSRLPSLPNSAPMSRQTSNSDFNSAIDGRIGPRSPSMGYHVNSSFRSYDLRQGREDPFPAFTGAWSLDELEASVELEKRDVAVQAVSSEDIQHDLDDYLSSLLAVLRNKEACAPMSSVANVATVGLARELLDMEDTTGLIAKLGSVPDSDIQIFLDFLIYLLDKNFLLEKGTHEMKRKARRLALKLLKKRPVLPSFLLLPDILVETDNQELGRGGFGFVLKGDMGGRPVALKVLHRVRRNDDFCREAFIWRTFSHEHVLALLGIYQKPFGRFLVSPYMENGTLSEWRKKRTPSVVDVQQRILEAAMGIRYIHSENMVHGDIRGDNVLLDGNFRVKITDFGLARHKDATATQSWALSYNFAAPELFGDCDNDDLSSESDTDVQLMKRTFKTDVYAFACLYYEIHFDFIPFKTNTHPQIIKMVTSGQRPPLLVKPELSAVAWKLIRRCWRKEPARRPSMGDVADSMVSWQAPPLTK